MKPERLLRIEALYHAARQSAPDGRETFLKEACGSDTELFRRVISLLAQDELDGPMDRPLPELAAEILDDFAASEWEPGKMVGPYRVERKLGEGGMGDVYLAHDTRLGRNVAVKRAKSQFSGRFHREAKAIAALNHPSICTLYDVGPDYLVMEYIEGTEIKGPLPVAEALRLAIQIAEAVNHAHRHGVIHRDLKPSNILVTKSGAKVLDFGLAKLSSADSAHKDAGVDESRLTAQGTIAGTPRYMAPEQLEGRVADCRSDVFAFGVVLYEVITGRPAFEGKSPANLMAAILTAEPPPVALFQGHVPLELVHLIETCLAKDPDDRKQNMHDILLDLRWVAATGSHSGMMWSAQAGRSRRELLPWGIAAVSSTAVLALGFFLVRQAPLPSYPVRFEKPVPPKNALRWWDTPAVSPDGRSFAYTGVKAGANPMLWLQRMDAIQPAPLPGTEDAHLPFWSPDGKYIAYFAGGHLRKIDANGGDPKILCGWPDKENLGGTWNQEGLILLGMSEGPLHQVNSNGGVPRRLLALDASRNEIRQGWPHFLPDGRHFVYTSHSSASGKSGIYLGSTDGQSSTRLLGAASNASFVAPNLLLFGSGRALMAQPFDLNSLRFTGDAVPIADQVGYAEITQNSIYSSSRNGVLVYRSEISAASELQPAWYDRDGKLLASVGEPRVYRQGSLSPDEKSFAAEILDLRTGIRDVWLLDLNSAVLSRVTSDPATKNTVVWSPDGREILFSSNKTGMLNLYRRVIGGGNEELVMAADDAIYPAQWLRDGSIIYLSGPTGKIFYRLPPGPNARPAILQKSEYSKDAPRVSPDGRWIAYNTDESGRWEVYVAAFPSFTERRQISSKGGVQGSWRRDGKELFYLSLDGEIVSVPIKPGPFLQPGSPKILFRTRVPVSARWDQYAVTGDGQRFFVLESIVSEAKPFTVLLNWPSAISR